MKKNSKKKMILWNVLIGYCRLEKCPLKIAHFLPFNSVFVKIKTRYFNKVLDICF